MTTRAPSGIALALAAATLCGCAAPSSVGDYFSDRAGDALDLVGLRFAVGPSLYAEVQFGRYVHVPVGLAVGGTDWVGLIDGRFTRKRPADTYGFPASNAFIITQIARDPTMEFDLLSIACVLCTKAVDADDGYVCLFFVPARVPVEYERTTPMTRWFDVSAEVAAGLRVRATVSPGEALDFLLGFLCLDPAGDDAP